MKFSTSGLASNNDSATRARHRYLGTLVPVILNLVLGCL
eukprot:SAG11_NODE_37135_length_258_cov_0.660377_1_plen_38_part_10